MGLVGQSWSFIGIVLRDALLCCHFPANQLIRRRGCALMVLRSYCWAVRHGDQVLPMLEETQAIISGSAAASQPTFNIQALKCAFQRVKSVRVCDKYALFFESTT